MDKYQTRSVHTPLDVTRNEVRLLTILPLVGGPRDLIECELDTCSLDDRPTYTALSYVWGDATKTRPVLVNGHVVHVTTNLADALFQLREDGVEVVWADALSINQNNDNEKNHQVQKMKTIYQMANYVIAWLGVESDTSKRGMLKLCEVAVLASSLNIRHIYDPPNGGMDGKQYDDNIRTAAEVLCECDTLKEEDIGSILSVMAMPFWSRLWIIQELCLAPFVTIACGSSRVSGAEVHAALAMLTWASWFSYRCSRKSTNTIARLRDLYHPFVLERWTRPPAIDLAVKVQKSGPNLDLGFVFGTTCNGTTLFASDPLDRVYALLGLVGDEDRNAITVDYTNSCGSLYAQVTRLLLSQWGTAFFLYCGSACQHRTQRYLPSWCLDWTFTGHRAEYLIKIAVLTRPVPDSPSDFEFITDDRVAVRGARFGRVAGVVPYSGGLEDLQNVIFSIGELYEQILEYETENLSISEHTASKEIIKVLIYGKAMVTSDLIHWTASLGVFEDYIQSQQSNLQNRTNSIDTHESGHGQKRNMDFDAGAQFKQNVEQIFWNTKPRNLFVTENGYIGSGSVCTQAGDVVYAFKGSRLPFILRAGEDEKTKGGWELVGAAYVNGGTFEDTADFWSMDPPVEDVILC
ncbi:HET-domain-containing protein [Dothidotthia symphoricarpi CBS 119687]|uniref:HET-domain-containing protein n=1 Tax=Dothidotthia symphoricarpi CBS 119687 TaxID=1392245 RepID=A0A6A6A7V2_9PLEO|nr:HET-domain-containing protein [Dothidotthia symphoricarpi CBS 119687]KAF2127243.1 HET-domain-containing protein [Dothidotthia symphoricarpi CBS 119687]